MQITINLANLSIDGLAHIGNALGAELDRANDPAFQPSLPFTHSALIRLQFMAVANEFTRRGLDVKGYLDTPESL